jgi:hypothetical protein
MNKIKKIKIVILISALTLLALAIGFFILTESASRETFFTDGEGVWTMEQVKRVTNQP